MDVQLEVADLPMQQTVGIAASTVWLKTALFLNSPCLRLIDNGYLGEERQRRRAFYQKENVCYFIELG